MIFHIGKGKSINQSEVIGVFDIDNATVSRISRTYLSKKTKENKIRYADDDIPRSFLLLQTKEGEESIYLSHISSRVLAARAENPLSSVEDENA